MLLLGGRARRVLQILPYVALGELLRHVAAHADSGDDRPLQNSYGADRDQAAQPQQSSGLATWASEIDGRDGRDTLPETFAAAPGPLDSEPRPVLGGHSLRL